MTCDLLTPRLSLTLLGPDDVGALHALWTQEAVRRYLWDGEVVPLERARDLADTNVRLFERAGYGIWAVRAHGEAPLIGFAGFWHFRTPPALELLFGVAPAQWNRGVATEASLEVIRYGFDVARFETINASTDAANAASLRVLQKLGLSFQRRVVLDGLDTVFYGVSRHDWAGR